MQRRELTCQELVEAVTDHLEGTLAETERERLEAHLASCQGCRRYVAQIRIVVVSVARVWSYDRS